MRSLTYTIVLLILTVCLNIDHPPYLSVKLEGLTEGKSKLLLTNHIYDIKYCRPKKIIRTRDSIGSYITGSYRTNSRFKFKRRGKFKNRKLCDISLNEKHKQEWKELIDKNARVEIFFDGRRISYRFGYIGKQTKKYYYRKHIQFTFGYNHRDH